MGQEPLKNGTADQFSCDILSQQMKIYQWRSDPNFNQHVARVSFKSAFAQHQEERYAQFLRLQENKQYLQIYKFKQQLNTIPDTKDQQVIIFENYYSSLHQLRGQLSFEETLYVLSALLTGFEQIKKVYEKVVVNSSCCFVTKEGSVRAWINPNPRSNQVWLGLLKQYVPESSHVQIISQIIRIVQESLRPSKRGHIFFSQLSKIFNTQTYKHSLFGLFRRWINEYCYLHRIQMAQEINLQARYKAQFQSPPHRQSHINAKQLKTQPRQEIINKENNPFVKTRSSQVQESPANRPLLIRCKSMEKDAFRFSYQDGEAAKQKEPARHIITQPCLNHYSSEIIQKNNIPNAKYSVILQGTKPDEICLNKINQTKESTFMWSDANKASSILKNKIDEVPSVKNTASKLSKVSKVSICQKYSSKEIQVSLHPSQQNIPQKMEQTAKKGVEKFSKSSMQVSIMKALPQHSEKEQVQVTRTNNNKYKTVYSPKKSIQYINESDVFSRPWITTKTITKLVSQNENQSSMKNSISESSQYYNTSNYSGALTQLGRDIVLKEQVQNGRSKTVRVSRQI